MMHGSVSRCYCLKWAAHNTSVALQAVQSESRLPINESAFHVTLHVLLHKLVTFLPKFHVLRRGLSPSQLSSIEIGSE